MSSLVGLILVLLVAAPIQWLDEERVQVSTEIKGKSASAHANAQFKLMRLAKQACRGKGAPVSDGSLELNEVVPEGKTKPKLVIKEVYRCIN